MREFESTHVLGTNASGTGWSEVHSGRHLAQKTLLRAPERGSQQLGHAFPLVRGVCGRFLLAVWAASVAAAIPWRNNG